LRIGVYKGFRKYIKKIRWEKKGSRLPALLILKEKESQVTTKGGYLKENATAIPGLG